MKRLFLLPLLLLSAAAAASPPNPYVVRGRDWSAEVQAYLSEARVGNLTPGEQRAYKASLMRRLPGEIRDSILAATGDPTVRDSAVPFTELELSSLPRLPPEYGPVAGFQAAFEARRDERFMDDPDPSHGDFMRRLTWLYQAQGCYARALLMSQGLEERGLERPLTLFVFPNNPGEWLRVETPWSPLGFVEWGFHVVPVVLSEGQLTVMDAAINPYEPMAVEDWLLTMLPAVEDARVAICGEYARLPDSSCWNSPASNDTRARYDEVPLMVKEWSLLQRMGYSPDDLLGDSPPWLEE